MWLPTSPGETKEMKLFIAVREAFRKEIRQQYTVVLLVNAQCWHLHSFCATGLSSGLVKGGGDLDLTRVSLKRLGDSITRE
jgi:hypothetical protein